MRAVSSKNDPIVQKPLHPAALKSIDAHPFQIKFHIFAKHGFQSGNDIFRFFFLVLVNIPTKLKVNAPHAIRLFVQKGGLAFVKRGIKPEPPFSRKFGLHGHISNEKIVFEHAPHKIQSQHLPRRAVGAITGNDPIRSDLIGTFGGLKGNRCNVAGLIQINNSGFATNINGCTVVLQFF